MNDVWDNLCRACLTTKDSSSYFLFENVSPKTYWFCTSVEVKEEDKLPRKLCSTCYKLIIQYSEFKKTCIQSQNTLLLQRKIDSENKSLSKNDNSELYVFHCDNDVTPELGNVKIEITSLDDGENTVNDLLKTEKTPIHDEEKTVDDLLKLTSEDDLMITKIRDISVKIEDLSHNFNEDPCPELLDQSPKSEEEIFLPQKRQKAKLLKVQRVEKETKTKLDISKKTNNYSCDLCSKKFRYHKRFEDHKFEHNSNESNPNLQCVPCNKSFQSPSSLRRHYASKHTSLRLSSLSCAACGRVCATKHSLHAHMKMHTDRPPQAVCHVCGKRVSSAIILRAHLETHKAGRERRHTCEHCGKKFYTNSILQSHIKRLHTGMRFICDICNFPFRHKCNLAKHILIHDGKKLYKCDICDKSFATKVYLVEHKRIHSGERPFLCSFCPKGFLSRRRLIDHQMIHTGDKPHKCQVCEQRFTQRGTLKRHMKVHDSIKVPVLVG